MPIKQPQYMIIAGAARMRQRQENNPVGWAIERFVTGVVLPVFILGVVGVCAWLIWKIVT